MAAVLENILPVDIEMMFTRCQYLSVSTTPRKIRFAHLCGAGRGFRDIRCRLGIIFHLVRISLYPRQAWRSVFGLCRFRLAPVPILTFLDTDFERSALNNMLKKIPAKRRVFFICNKFWIATSFRCSWVVGLLAITDKNVTIHYSLFLILYFTQSPYR